MKGELVLEDIIEDEKAIFGLSFFRYDFTLSIGVDDNEALERQLKNREAFDYSMEFIRSFESLTSEQEEKLRYLESHFDTLLDSIDYIVLNFEEYDIKEYIAKNPILLSKKIVLNETLEIADYDRLIELMSEYEDIIDKVYVTLVGNESYVSLLDCYKTMTTIKKQVESINRLGLSPMETIMYVYDQVRNRVYTVETETETAYKSRDLSEVMFGDKIVCVGYANMFYTLLSYLGIRSVKVDLEKIDEDSGHLRNMVYVKDPKYGIDGVYYFDTTWDSKEADGDNSYLDSYYYFARTKQFMEARDRKSKYEDKDLSGCLEDMCQQIEQIVISQDYCELLPYVRAINFMARISGEDILIDGKERIDMALGRSVEFDRESFLKGFRKIVNKFNREIPAETMILLLNNVRKLEYYENPEWYPYSSSTLYVIFMNSGWKFNRNHCSCQMLFNMLFGEELKQEITPFDNFKNYINDNGLVKDMKQVQLTKTLQMVLEKKRNSDDSEGIKTRR